MQSRTRIELTIDVILCWYMWTTTVCCVGSVLDLARLLTVNYNILLDSLSPLHMESQAWLNLGSTLAQPWLRSCLSERSHTVKIGSCISRGLPSVWYALSLCVGAHPVHSLHWVHRNDHRRIWSWLPTYADDTPLYTVFDLVNLSPMLRTMLRPMQQSKMWMKA